MRDGTHSPVSRAWEATLLQKISFGGKFEMNATVASFSALLFFYEAKQRFKANGNFIFAADFQEKNPTVCDLCGIV